MNTKLRHESRRLLVTGPTGYLGRAILPGLIQDGWSLSLLVREATWKSPRLDWLRRIVERVNSVSPGRIRILIGDVELEGFGVKRDDLADHWGALHMAALPKLGRQNSLEMERLHLGGAMEVSRLAMELDWRRVFHVSTAFVPVEPSESLPEAATSPYLPGANNYERTKLGAEYIVSGMLRDRAEIIRPGIIVPDAEKDCYGVVQASPLEAIARTLVSLAGAGKTTERSLLPFPFAPELRTGFCRLEDTTRFIRERLLDALAAADSDEGVDALHHKKAKFWNVVFEGPNNAEFLDALSHEFGIHFFWSLGAKAALKAFAPWRPYLGSSRQWNTGRTEEFCRRARIPYGSPSANEVIQSIARIYRQTVADRQLIA